LSAVFADINIAKINRILLVGVESNKGNHARPHTEAEGKSTDYVYQVYETQSGILWAKLCGELDPSLAARGWKSSGAADVAD